MTEVQQAEKRDEKSVEEKREVKKTEERREQIKQAEVYELGKESLKIQKKAPLLNIPLEVVTPSRTSGILTPHVSIIPHASVKLDVINTRTIQSSILTPKLKVLKKPPRDIRVQVYEPLKIVELTCPSLNLKLKPPEDWSIRPLLKPLTITDLGLLNPRFRCRLKRIKRLETFHAPSIKSDKKCTPKIRIAQTYFTMEEIKRVVYKLWLMRFDEDFIIECIKRAYGKVLSLSEVRKIIAEGEKGYVEIGMLPTYVNGSIKAIIAEKGGVYLRGTQTKLTLPEEKRPEQEIKHVMGKMLPELVKKTSSRTASRIFSSLLEYLLEMQYLSDEYHKLGGLGGVSDEGLICILVDKSRDFHQFIEHVCKEMWRIKSRGLPSVSDKGWEELRWYGLHEDVIELDKAQQMIESLIEKKDDNKAFNEAKDAFIKEVKSKSIEGRLRFLLLPVEGEKFKESYDILTDPRIEIERYLKYCKFFAFKLRTDLEEELLARVLSATFGFAKVSLHSHRIGQYILGLYGEFDRKLGEIIKRIREKVDPAKWPKPHPEECPLHKALKHLAYAHLLFNERIGEEHIDSEVEVDGIRKVDVYCKNPARKIAIEIETMYGTGDPGAKINHETIMPYYEKKFDGELWLVIPNLQAFLFLEELLRLRKYYREQRLKLEIYVADVTGEGARQIYGEKKAPGLIKLVDVLNFIRGEAVDVNSRFEVDC
jgi:hypothetical protein